MSMWLLVMLLAAIGPPGVSELSFPEHWNGTACTAATSDGLATTPQCALTDGLIRFSEVRPRVDYYWISRDGTALRVGTAREMNAIDLQEHQVGAIKFNLDDIAGPKGNAAAKITIRSDQATWTVPTTAMRASRLRIVYVPPGLTTIVFDIAGFRRTVRRDIRLVPGKIVDVGEIALLAMPEISGTVVYSADRAPIHAANVMLPDGALAAVTDDRGHFAFVPRSLLPISISVEASGFAPKSVEVRRGVDRFDLGEIALDRGSSLTLKAHRACSDECTTTVTVLRHEEFDPRPGRWKSVARSEGKGAGFSLTFQGLALGDYVLSFAGTESLQRMLVPLTIRDARASQTVEIRDARLKGTVSLGDTLLPHTSLELSTKEQAWNAVIQTDERGEFDLPTWSPASLRANVSVPGQQKTYFTSKAFGDGEQQYWDIVIPVTEITGRVVDSATGQAIDGATVSDAVISGPQRHGPEPTKTDDSGRFHFPMVPAAMHRLTASAPGYADGLPVDVEFAEAGGSRNVELQMERGVSIDLKIINEDGTPAANAEIFDWFGPDGLSTIQPRLADAFGAAHYNLRRNERKGLCVLGPNHSFAVFAIDANTKSSPAAPLPVFLPSPTASLEVFVTSGGKPVRGVMVFVRHDGTFIPPGFFEQITMDSRTASTTDATGRIFLPQAPPGLYEFWPFRTYADYSALLRNIRLKPPGGRVVAAPGVNRVYVSLD